MRMKKKKKTERTTCREERKAGKQKARIKTMTTKHTHEIPLEDGTYIAVRYHYRDGTVTSFAVVLVAWIDGKPKCVARYDDAHDTPHLDIMGRNGRLREKIWLPRLTRAEGLENAIIDFKTHWQDYIGRYRAE